MPAQDWGDFLLFFYIYNLSLQSWASHLAVDFQSGFSCFTCGLGACGSLAISRAAGVACITCLENISALATSFYPTFQSFDSGRMHLPMHCRRRATLVVLISPLLLTLCECPSLPVSTFLE